MCLNMFILYFNEILIYTYYIIIILNIFNKYFNGSVRKSLKIVIISHAFKAPNKLLDSI